MKMVSHDQNSLAEVFSFNLWHHRTPFKRNETNIAKQNNKQEGPEGPGTLT